jgi:hypothetical protein
MLWLTHGAYFMTNMNGTMDETFPVKKEEPDDTVVVSTGSTDSATFVNFDLNDPD